VSLEEGTNGGKNQQVVVRLTQIPSGRYGRYHPNQRAAPVLASVFILAEGVASVVSSPVWREGQNGTPLAQSAGKLYVLGQDGLAC
jgi:hypothetical protein